MQSTTGSNIANIHQEFGQHPLLCEPTLFLVKKKETTEVDRQNLDLLEDLFQQKHDEGDPDTVIELEGLINQICET